MCVVWAPAAPWEHGGTHRWELKRPRWAAASEAGKTLYVLWRGQESSCLCGVQVFMLLCIWGWVPASQGCFNSCFCG